MQVFIKYKHKNDAYSKGQGFYDLREMYYENRILPYTGSLYAPVNTLGSLAFLMEKNQAIFVLDDSLESAKGCNVTYDVIEPHIKFILNTSEIAKVFPVDTLLSKSMTPEWTPEEENKEKEEEEERLRTAETGGVLPFVGTTNQDGFVS